MLSDPEMVALKAALAKYSSEASDWESFPLTSATSENWATVREEWPVLAARSDQELKTALDTFLNNGPDPLAVITQTPVGPVIGINLFLFATGLSWCDTPFGNAAACVEVAARKAAEGS